MTVVRQPVGGSAAPPAHGATQPRLSRPGHLADGRHQADHPGVHVESVVLRVVLAAVLAYQLLTGHQNGAIVAAIGAALTLVPIAVSRLSGWHVPRVLELAFVGAIVLQFVSESFKLFEVFTYWDKIVHPGEIFLASGVTTFLFLGYRKLHQLDLPDGLAAFGAMLFGSTLGATWELIEFAVDWFGNANLQKSNADTMTDVMTNNIGAIFGTLLAFWWYRHRATEAQKIQFGEVATWLTDRLAKLVTRHGRLLGVVVALLAAAIIAAGWFMDRSPVPPPSGQPAASRTWAFQESGAAALEGTAAIVETWRIEDGVGLCRVNAEKPQPGSEEMGLYGLAPDASYGDRPFSLSTRWRSSRPPFGDGITMDAGLVFGLRGPEDFYLLRASATHDVLVLERYLHGKRRDSREERLRTRGGEWHDLRVEVDGDRVIAYSDDRPLFEERGLVETTGGVALWGRATTDACFSEAAVQVPPAPASASASRPGPLARL